MTVLLDDEGILNQVSVLMDVIKARLRAEMDREALGLAPMEARTLAYLQRHPGCSQADFAGYTRRDKAQVARLVKPLIERGLVASLPDTADRRINRLWLTEDGAALQRRAARHRASLAHQMLAGLTLAERAEAARLLERLAENLRNG
ncbi:MAG TPA: MarR family transcriptional regulator [Telluria sp.]|nr:MarR family transcriptional regulator [Telluria sp.]